MNWITIWILLFVFILSVAFCLVIETVYQIWLYHLASVKMAQQMRYAIHQLQLVIKRRVKYSHNLGLRKPPILAKISALSKMQELFKPSKYRIKLKAPTRKPLQPTTDKLQVK